MMKRLTKRRREKLLNTKPRSDVPEMKDYPLNVYAMAVCNMCLKHMKKLGVSESVAIHLSTKDGTHGFINFATTRESYTLKGGKWTKIPKEEQRF